MDVKDAENRSEQNYDAISKTFGAIKQYIGQISRHSVCTFPLGTVPTYSGQLRHITVNRYRQMHTEPHITYISNRITPSVW